jgi:hypothetical protein
LEVKKNRVEFFLLWQVRAYVPGTGLTGKFPASGIREEQEPAVTISGACKKQIIPPYFRCRQGCLLSLPPVLQDLAGNIGFHA